MTDRGRTTLVPARGKTRKKPGSIFHRPPPHRPPLAGAEFCPSEKSSKTGRQRFWRIQFRASNSVSLLALTEFQGESSVSSSQPTIHVPNRSHRVSAELSEFGAELSELSLSKQYSRKSILPVSYCPQDFYFHMFCFLGREAQSKTLPL